MTEREIFDNTISAYGLDKEPFEIRFLNGFKGGIQYGYFADVDKAFEVISPYWRRITCYFTLQEINPCITARCLNSLEQTKKTTGDADVINYKWLHIDIDPVRPSGIQASEDERQYAVQRAKEIKKFMEEIFLFPEALIVSSGNGITMDYRTEKIAVTEESKKLMKDVLQTLSLLFSDDRANVDTTVHNPSRIIKFAGTISAKGSNTEERPYRYSRIIKIPRDKSVVKRKQLMEVAGLLEELSGEKK